MRNIVFAAALLAFSTPAFAVEFDGNFTQGGMIIGTVEPGDSVIIDGQTLSISDDGKFVFGFGRDHGPTARLAVMGPGDDETTAETIELTIAPRDYDIQRIDGLPPGKVGGFSEATLKRIAADNAQVAAARRDTQRRDNFLEGFIWPAKGRISGVYGSQRVLNGEPRRPHFGVDIAAPVGTPIHAPAGGIVTLAESDHFFTGGIIIIDHGYSLNSTLFHMNTVDVEVGQVVAQGEQIGTVGQSGRATGPHVDWRMNWADQRLDPQLLVGPMPD